MNGEALAVLESALADTGRFRWWGEQLPKVVQLEFTGVQVWTPPPAPDRPPRGMLALAFIQPRSVSFLSRGGIEADWPTRLRADRMDPLDMSHEQITLRDPVYAAELLGKATRVDTIHGTPPGEVDWAAAGAMLVFWAGAGGVAVAADRLHLVTHDAPMPLEEFSEAHARWWRYWREYWDRRGTPDPLPKDWNCEVTIPIGGPARE